MKRKPLQMQIRAMMRDWPQFGFWPILMPKSVRWLGPLVGLERPFLISIEYGDPVPGCRSRHRVMPVVRVHEPSLVPNPNAKEEAPLPHVYFEKPDIRLSPLCLFDPAAKQWNPSMLISRTTVGWAARWLAAYEFWEATGLWTAGGRHDEIDPKEELSYDG